MRAGEGKDSMYSSFFYRGAFLQQLLYYENIMRKPHDRKFRPQKQLVWQQLLYYENMNKINAQTPWS